MTCINWPLPKISRLKPTKTMNRKLFRDVRTNGTGVKLNALDASTLSGGDIKNFYLFILDKKTKVLEAFTLPLSFIIIVIIVCLSIREMVLWRNEVFDFPRQQSCISVSWAYKLGVRRSCGVRVYNMRLYALWYKLHRFAVFSIVFLIWLKVHHASIAFWV